MGLVKRICRLLKIWLMLEIPIRVTVDLKFFKWAICGLFFVYFLLFKQFNFYARKIVDFSRTRTRIVRVEGEHADHLTTTTARVFKVSCLFPASYFAVKEKSFVGERNLKFCTILRKYFRCDAYARRLAYGCSS